MGAKLTGLMGLPRRPALLLVLLALLLAAPAHSRKKKARTEWDTAVLEALDTDECTVERVAAGALSRERFDKEFRHRQPVLIEGLASAEGWPAMSLGVWQRRELLELSSSSLLISAAVTNQIIRGLLVLHPFLYCG